MIGSLVKVHIFWEGHKILRNFPLIFDYSTHRSKGKILQNFVAFSEYMNFKSIVILEDIFNLVPSLKN